MAIGHGIRRSCGWVDGQQVRADPVSACRYHLQSNGPASRCSFWSPDSVPVQRAKRIMMELTIYGNLGAVHLLAQQTDLVPAIIGGCTSS